MTAGHGALLKKQEFDVRGNCGSFTVVEIFLFFYGRKVNFK